MRVPAAEFPLTPAPGEGTFNDARPADVRLARMPGNRVAGVWRQFFSTPSGVQDVIAFSSRATGSTWGVPEVVVAERTGSSLNPQALVTPGGTATVIYDLPMVSGQPAEKLRSATRVAPNTWQVQTIVEATNAAVFDAAAGATGRAAVGWIDGFSGSQVARARP